MDKFKNYRDESRLRWGRTVSEDTHLSGEDIRQGAILRIADATELMAKNYAQLQREHDHYKRRFEEEVACSKRLLRSNAALRGCLKRVKKP